MTRRTVSTRFQISVLRGICQTPAYVAYKKGFFAEAGIDVHLDVAATAWLVPKKLVTGESHFGVIPRTRVAAAVAGALSRRNFWRSLSSEHLDSPQRIGEII